jgi:hypothetical protein
MGSFRMEESEGLVGLGDAACDEEFSEDERDARCLGEGVCFNGMRIREDPPLFRRPARCGSGSGFSCRAHPRYSSSSS